MFGIFKNLKQGAELNRLRKRGQVDSRPGSYIELCRLLLARGKTQAAVEAAVEGLERFPHSEQLRDFARLASRQLRAKEIRELEQRCEQDGALESYLELARLYRDCDEFDDALALVEELERRQPDDMQGVALQGEILLERFYRDMVANDAKRAIAALRRVVEAEPGSFSVHFALARLHHFVGATSKALFHVYRALDADPEHVEAGELYDVLIAQPLEKKDLNTLLRETEEGAESRSEEELTPEKRREIVAGLSRLSLLNGVTRTAFVNGTLTLVAERGDCRVMADGATDTLCEIARGFRRAASLSCKRMGIGAFQSSVLQAGERMLQFHSVGSMVVLVESADERNADMIRTECSSFVASTLRVVEEPVHA